MGKAPQRAGCPVSIPPSLALPPAAQIRLTPRLQAPLSFFAFHPPLSFYTARQDFKISSIGNLLPTKPPPLNQSSKLLFGDSDDVLVTQSVASPPQSVTIPTLDFTSFTTDSQPSWSSTPLTQAASALPQHNFDQDFQLFNSPRPATLTRPSQGQATLRTAPNQPASVPLRHSIPVSQPQHQQSTIGYPQLPNNYRSLTNPNAQQQHYQRIIARQVLTKRTQVPKFHVKTTPPRHRHSAPESVPDMSLFDHLDFQGGFHGDASLDLDTSFNSNNMLDSPQAHAATVSPTELFTDDFGITSNPGSSAFPPLATPGSEYFDSPDFSSAGLNTTPMLDGVLDGDLDFTKLDNMPSLFPDTQYTSSPAIVQNNSFGSLSDLSHEQAYEPAKPAGTPMVRQKSSPGRPPIVHDRKASLSAGITKGNQKSRKDLPDIVIDSDDDRETAKRKKNTAAARKSRQRRQEAMGAMASEIARLRAIVESLGGDPDAELDT